MLQSRRRVRVHPRTQIACINCKDTKLRCDNQVPSCKNCQRHNLTCLIEDPITGKHHVRNYVEILERKISALENQLHYVNSNTSFAHTHEVAERGRSAVSVSPALTISPGSVRELSSHAGILGVKTYNGEPHYLGSSSAFAFTRVLHASLQLHPPSGSEGLSTATLEESVPSSQHLQPLPSSDLGMKLSNAYFANIHPQYPFLHKPTFRRWENMARELANLSHDTVSDPAPLFFVHMVYAVGALLLQFPESFAQRLYLSAQSYVDAILVHDNLESIQALLCYVMYSLRSTTGPSVWKLSGLALRQSIQLGYHRNLRQLDCPLDFLKLEMRKRVFWCSFGIDCVASLTLGRPLSLHLEEVDVELPGDFNDNQLTEAGKLGLPRDPSSSHPTDMSTAIHVFRLHSLWSRIHISLYSDTDASSPSDPIYATRVETFREELEQWIASVPPLPPRAEPSLSIFATRDWFDLNYSETIIMIYRGQLASKEPANEVVFVECAQAAATICHRYRRQYLNTQVRFTWGSLHVLFSAGLTYLHCIWMSSGVRETHWYEKMNRTLTDCTMLLVVMAERWKVAEPYRNIFEVLSQRTMTMATREKSGIENRTNRAAEDSDESNRDSLSQWTTQIFQEGMSDGVDKFLCGLLEDCCSHEEAIRIGEEILSRES